MFKRFPFILPLLASLSFGLAPFFETRHIIGKIRWLKGGGTGMEVLDYFDLLVHSTPWIWFIISLLKWSDILKKKNVF